MNKKTLICLLPLSLCAAGTQAETLEQRVQALEEQRSGGTEVTIGGYIKLDAQFSRFNRQDRAGNVGDDFLVPSTIATEGSNSQWNADFHAKESRINFATTTETDWGDLETFIEVDFLASMQGDERITNGYSTRLRHAFARFNNWTLGQTWSTFFEPASLPDLLDFVGPVGNGFARQAQVRYSPGNWDFALENPSSTFFDESTGELSSGDDNRVPDAIVRYRVPDARGDYSLAVMGREIAWKADDAAGRETEYGYGAALSARVPVGDGGSDLRAQVNAGNALGRYMGLNGFQDAAIDEDGGVELVDQIGGFIAYRQVWTPKWRSNVSLSHSYADNPSGTADDVAQQYSSAHLNLIHSPVPMLDVGGELIWAQREDEGGATGELSRVQLSARLSF